MNAHLIIDADVLPTGGTLLLEVAMGLREHRIRPHSLVLSCITSQDRVKLLVEFPAGRENGVLALAERFRNIPGVQKIVLNERTP